MLTSNSHFLTLTLVRSVGLRENIVLFGASFFEMVNAYSCSSALLSDHYMSEKMWPLAREKSHERAGLRTVSRHDQTQSFNISKGTMLTPVSLEILPESFQKLQDSTESPPATYHTRGETLGQ